jgi:Tol biopolymer transport system component
MHTSKFMRSTFTTVAVMVGLIVLLMSSLAWASFPGKNGRIVFVANSGGSWQLYTIKPDGSDMVQLTHMDPTSDSSWEPSYSPSGRQIAFDYGPVDSSGNAHPDLYVINADGTGLTQLTHDGLSQAPRWSPDGTKLIFARQSTLTGQTVVTEMRADGTGQKKALTSDFWSSFADSYTPDGSKINFDSQMGGLVSAEWIMNADGSGMKQLTAAPLEGGVSDVSPDGKQIVFNSHDNSPLFPAIFVMNLDGSDLQQLTYPPDQQVDLGPVYSPDGTKIVFASSRIDPGSLDLFVMNADGSNITAIATGLTVGGCPSGNCVQPGWGPEPMSDSISERSAFGDPISFTSSQPAARCLKAGMECRPGTKCCPGLVCQPLSTRAFCEPNGK